MDVQRWLSSGVGAVADWEAGFVAFRPDPSAAVTDERFAAAFEAFTQRLRDNYPYFHPSYAGQMLKPPHPAAVVGYLTAMLINPNNHALDSSRAGVSPTAPRRTTPTAGCAGCSDWRGLRSRPTPPAAWTRARWRTCSRGAGSG